MKLVKTEEDIRKNLARLEYYLRAGSEQEQQFAHDLICKGKCFIAYEIDGMSRFSPSRYTSYLKNTRNKHKNNQEKQKIDGRETNVAIQKIIDNPLKSNDELESKYHSFTSRLGIEPMIQERKYWRLDLQNSNEIFPEGEIFERKHKSRERNAKLIVTAKREFLKKNDRLHCAVCKFDFEKKYGERGRDFIEAHHTVPVSTMKPGETTKLEDIVLLCSNCHKILHRTRPWLSMEELKEIIKHNGVNKIKQ